MRRHRKECEGLLEYLRKNASAARRLGDPPHERSVSVQLDHYRRALASRLRWHRRTNRQHRRDYGWTRVEY